MTQCSEVDERYARVCLPPGAGIARLEADIAYFDARLALLGEPRTPHERAQLKAWRLLQGRLIAALVCLKARAMSGAIAPPAAGG